MPYGRMSLGAKLPMDVIPASSVMGDDWHGVQGHGVPQDKVFEPSLECEVRKHGLYRENIYQLGDGLVITSSTALPMDLTSFSADCRGTILGLKACR